MFKYSVLLLTLFLDILKEAPNEYDLLHLLADIDYLWLDIGGVFNVDDITLYELSKSVKDDIVKLSEVIYSCVSTTKLQPFTWEIVISAIEKMENCRAFISKEKADQIREHILKGKEI